MSSATLLSVFSSHGSSFSVKSTISGSKQSPDSRALDIFLNFSHIWVRLKPRYPGYIPVIKTYHEDITSGQNQEIWWRKGLASGTLKSITDLSFQSSLSPPESAISTDEQNLTSPLSEEARDKGPLPTMEDIIAAAAEQGLVLTIKTFGPSFQIFVKGLDGKKSLGGASGWIRPWTNGKILHLESVSLARGLSKQVKTMFGAGFYVGAATLRFGLDYGCRTAELLAILDDEDSHAKLVKYYSRLGFKKVYEVNEEDLKYLPDRVMWGGVGTRMDADCKGLLQRWSSLLTPKANLKAAWRRKQLSSKS